jgi:hypothetical protein
LQVCKIKCQSQTPENEQTPKPSTVDLFFCSFFCLQFADSAGTPTHVAVAAITKNVPLVTTIGFEIASEAGASGHAAAPLSSSAERLASLEKANSDKGVAAAHAAPAADESKSKKTFITDYDIIETLGEGSFGAVREEEKREERREKEKKVFFFFFPLLSRSPSLRLTKSSL